VAGVKLITKYIFLELGFGRHGIQRLSVLNFKDGKALINLYFYVPGVGLLGAVFCTTF
jgi:hypothetical protein